MIRGEREEKRTFLALGVGLYEIREFSRKLSLLWPYVTEQGIDLILRVTNLVTSLTRQFTELFEIIYLNQDQSASLLSDKYSQS